ncbi:PadR family transcriptional regulator [Actinoplanes derwentensis]|uniref:Transcriptional regulator PadR-like family protein n=1 Tax=Actinoplanes derwentensis TaxID=113562 RepID=A0A1H2CQV8_9ACTN|nr:PadR family transcriptional regulator [Actinoplanes derwentensis]GID90481.1 PadR family transcriptional regulator [Actinoplanes derwentensis]SDT72898.1 Transcriptional regulator PadR-like family protein [Actinoplanes derwentensis]
MSTAHVLLGLLAAGPRHGYDLKRVHDERLPQAKPLAFGQVYATLGRLERDGFVEQSGQERESGPERTTFSLTVSGRERLDHWLAEVEPPAPHLSSVLFSKVVVALVAADADRARHYLTAQRTAHVARMRELTAVKTSPGASVGDVIAADYAIGHLDADLRWLRTTMERVAELHKEVTS